jgi:hypothetical protein
VIEFVPVDVRSAEGLAAMIAMAVGRFGGCQYWSTTSEAAGTSVRISPTRPVVTWAAKLELDLTSAKRATQLAPLSGSVPQLRSARCRGRTAFRGVGEQPAHQRGGDRL